MGLAGLPEPGSAARAQHCSGWRKGSQQPSVLQGDRSRVRARPVQLGADGKQAVVHKPGGKQPCNNGGGSNRAAGWRAHLSQIHWQAKPQTCIWVQAQRAHWGQAACHPSPHHMSLSEVPVGNQLGKGDIFSQSIHCLVVITGLCLAPVRIVS